MSALLLGAVTTVVTALFMGSTSRALEDAAIVVLYRSLIPMLLAGGAVLVGTYKARRLPTEEGRSRVPRARAAPRPHGTLETDSMATQARECPFCEARISMTASKCRHCGEWVDGRQ